MLPGICTDCYSRTDELEFPSLDFFDIPKDEQKPLLHLKEIFETAKTDFPELFNPTPAKPNGTADGGAKGNEGISQEEVVKQAFEKTGRKNSFRL